MWIRDKPAWIDAFVMHINRLGSTASPESLVEIAETYYESHAGSDPVKVAAWHCSARGLP
jgi:hypothetical protein